MKLFALSLLIAAAFGCASGEPAWENFASQDAGSGGDDQVVVAAGDIADCTSRGDEATAELLRDIPGTVLTLGDNAYDGGTAEEFADCYGPSWGRYRDRTRAAPGNHDYATPEAKGYFGFFGKAAGNPEGGYYSYDLGGWHMVALNSNCEEIGGCDAGSPQGRWLRADLAEHRSECSIAYFHHPLFSAGKYRPGVRKVRPLWDALYAARVDVVLNGHDHNYQRFAPQDPEGREDRERGIREFVVGTGGSSLYPILAPVANSEVYDDGTYGVLKLTLRQQGYDWQFIPVEGSHFSDSGSDSCR